MLHSRITIRRIKYLVLVGLLMATWPGGTGWIALLSPFSGSAEELGATGDSREKSDAATRCRPALASKPKPAWPKAIHSRRGEVYRQDPIVSFEINEQGRVENVKTVRTSGLRDIDSWVEREIARWKYKPAPGCGVRHSETIVTVDFDLIEPSTQSKK